MLSKKKRKKKYFALKLLIILLIPVLIIFLIDQQIRPIITTYAGYKIKNIASRAINSAIINEFVDNQISYDSLIHISRDNEGIVTSVVADTSLMNKIKADLISMVLTNIANTDSLELSIPIGTLSGIPLLSERGPRLQIRILPSSMIDAQFESRFEAVGINQSLHRVFIHFTIELTAVIPGYTTSVSIDTDVAIAETVIVGLIPGSYTQVTDGSSSLISKINDYKD